MKKVRYTLLFCSSTPCGFALQYRGHLFCFGQGANINNLGTKISNTVRVGPVGPYIQVAR